MQNRIVLVTGSTSGIGLEIAKKFADNEYTVFINYASDKSKAEKAVSELHTHRVHLVQADVSIESQVTNMFEKIRYDFGFLDVLVNNAGTSINESIGEINVQNFRRVLDVNLIGKVLCTKYALPLLKKAVDPCIINVASRLGIKPCVGASAYCASEAALINFTQASALELASYSIRVNSVSPGLTLTSLSQSKWSSEEIEKIRARIPLGRLGKTTDISAAVFFLASTESGYINGENINISGGVLLT